MKVALVVIGVIILAVLAVFGWAMGSRNTLVTEREAVNAAWSSGGRRAAAPRRIDSQPGRHGQPARRRDDDGDQPGDRLEGQAVPGYPLRHRRGAHGHLRPQWTPPGRAIAGGPEEPPQLHVNQILVKLVEARGSDLHLTAGRPPMVRVDGDLRPMEGFDVLTPSKVRDLVYEILSQKLGSASRPTWSWTRPMSCRASAGSG